MARQAWARDQKTAMAARHAKELAALKVRQDFALGAKTGEWVERQRAGEDAIRRELEAQRQTDQMQQKTGMLEAFRVLTGRAGREAFDQQAREGQRVEAARQKAEALNTGIAGEQREFLAGQRRDHAALIDSHKQDSAKIQTAIAARHQIDRGEERAARQPAGYVIQQEQKHERGHGIGWELSP